jgi:hypothetical protein
MGYGVEIEVSIAVGNLTWYKNFAPVAVASCGRALRSFKQKHYLVLTLFVPLFSLTEMDAHDPH